MTNVSQLPGPSRWPGAKTVCSPGSSHRVHDPPPDPERKRASDSLRKKRRKPRSCRALVDAGGGTRTPDTRIMIGADLQGFYVGWAFSVGLGLVRWGHFCSVGDKGRDTLWRDRSVAQKRSYRTLSGRPLWVTPRAGCMKTAHASSGPRVSFDPGCPTLSCLPNTANSGIRIGRARNRSVASRVDLETLEKRLLLRDLQKGPKGSVHPKSRRNALATEAFAEHVGPALDLRIVRENNSSGPVCTPRKERSRSWSITCVSLPAPPAAATYPRTSASSSIGGAPANRRSSSSMSTPGIWDSTRIASNANCE